MLSTWCAVGAGITALTSNVLGQMGASWSSNVDEASQNPGVFNHLLAVDKVTITVVVDNESDGISTPCPCCDGGPAATARYTSEFNAWTQAVLDGKLEYMDFSKAVMAGHGLSLLITTELDGRQRSALLDGGPREDLWSSNAAQLAVDVTSLETTVLTHWHPDHSVGLAAVAALSSQAKAGSTHMPDLVFDVHPHRPYRRGFRAPTGQDIMFNPDVELRVLQQPGNCIQQHQDPHLVLGSTAFVSGVIPRVTPYEQGMPSHITQHRSDTPAELDPLILDERCLAVKGDHPPGSTWLSWLCVVPPHDVQVKGLGVLVFTGCSHAGVVNVVKHISSLCGSGDKVIGVIGGLHLSGRVNEARITQTIAGLKAELGPGAVILAGHCTGWRAKAALAAAFKEGFQPCVVGGTYEFEGKPGPETSATS